MATTAKTRTKAKARPAPEPEEVEEEKDYTAYLDKPATDLQTRFAEWIQTVTGYEPNDDEDFAAGVQLATALRMEFQRSPENQAVLEQKRLDAEAAKEERASKPAAKRGRPKKVVEDVEDEVEEDAEDVEEAKPTPKRKAARAKVGATTKTATKTSATRARRARPAAKAKEEAPF